MTTLIPTNLWVYDLFQITYYADENSPAQVTDYLVSSCENHMIGDIEDRWPGEWATYYRWERVAEGVKAPRVIGQLYGIPMHESGWAAGRREAEKRSLLAS